MLGDAYRTGSDAEDLARLLRGEAGGDPEQHDLSIVFRQLTE